MWTAAFTKVAENNTKFGFLVLTNGVRTVTTKFEISANMTDADIAYRAKINIDYLEKQEASFDTLTEGIITPALPVPTADEIHQQTYIKNYQTLKNLTALVEAKILLPDDQKVLEAQQAVKDFFKPEYTGVITPANVITP